MDTYINEGYEYLIPERSAFTYDDVYRFITNNCIGRSQYQPILNTRVSAGKCIGALADLAGAKPTSDTLDYTPANLYKICYDKGISQDEYHAAARTIADEITKQRQQDGEPFQYWYFAVNNSYRLMKEAFKT